jgi:hypothetical protein
LSALTWQNSHHGSSPRVKVSLGLLLVLFWTATVRYDRPGGAGMSTVTLLAAGLTVPAATFTGLWFWRLRPGRRADLLPSTETVLVHKVAKAYALQQELRAQVEALGRGFEDRDRRLAAQVSGAIETAAKAAEILPGLAAKRLGGHGRVGGGEHSDT